MGGGNTYFPCDLVFSCNCYFHNQFSGALSSVFIILYPIILMGLFVMRLMTLLCLYCFCFCCRLSTHQQYVNLGFKNYRCQGNYIPLAVSWGECIFNNSPSYWLHTYCNCWLLRFLWCLLGEWPWFLEKLFRTACISLWEIIHISILVVDIYFSCGFLPFQHRHLTGTRLYDSCWVVFSYHLVTTILA